MSVDWMKPIKQKNGCAARHPVPINRDNDSKFKWCVIIADSSGIEQSETYTDEGRSSLLHKRDYDIINVPPKPVKVRPERRFFNVYPNGSMDAYQSLELAHDCCDPNRIGVYILPEEIEVQRVEWC